MVWSPMSVVYSAYMASSSDELYLCYSFRIRRRWIILLRTGEPPVIQFMYYIKFLVEVVGPLPSLRQRYICNVLEWRSVHASDMRLTKPVRYHSAKCMNNKNYHQPTLHYSSYICVQNWRIRWVFRLERITCDDVNMPLAKSQGKGKWFCTRLCCVHIRLT